MKCQLLPVADCVPLIEADDDDDGEDDEVSGTLATMMWMAELGLD